MRLKSAGSGSLTLWLRMAICLCAFACTTNAHASDVWVVTDQHHAIKVRPGVRVIELDAPARIRGALAAQLPADSKRAAAIVQQRLRQGGANLPRRLAEACQGVIDAWRLRVTKIPAVVVDQRYVVYGEPDVDRAVAWIENYRRTQK